MSGTEKPLHNGNLAQDSPALFSRLSKMFKDEELERANHAYTITYSQGGADETPVMREAGVNYNPKPARICQILIEECEERSLKVLCAAMLACVKIGAALNLPQNLLEEEKLAQEVRTTNVTNFKSCASFEIQRIFLAKYLDTFRHLHMTTLANEEKLKLFHEASTEILSYINDPLSKRLTILLEASINRAKRQYGDDE